MKTKKVFELREGNFYRGTFKSEKAAIKHLEEHFKMNYKMCGYTSIASCIKEHCKDYTISPVLKIVG